MDYFESRRVVAQDFCQDAFENGRATFIAQAIGIYAAFSQRREFSPRRASACSHFTETSFRNAWLLHGHAVEHRAHFHGLAIMRDHDELRLAAHVREHFVEAADIGFIERRIHFVEDTEWTRPETEDSDQKGQRCERFFSAGKQQDVLQALAGRLRSDIDASFAGTVRFGQPHLARAAAKERLEGDGKMRVDEVEGLFKFLARDLVEFVDGLVAYQSMDCSQILAFASQEV